MQEPTIKPKNPNFSSGPCSKRPDWSVAAFDDAFLGRSHRAAGPKAKLKEVIEMHRDLLGIPKDYKIGIVPASDTGAFEMAMWSMLGARGVDVFAWESFSTGWMKDITDHLRLEDVNCYKSGYGDIPDLSRADPARDTVFVWNGTTGGVCVPDGEWIAADREGLTFCDATSAVFAYDMPWDKLDVTTWSWQKVLGGEAAHGMLVLSPRAVARLESYVPEWPLPKIFRLTKGGKLNEGIFKGATINTPSMLAVEDCLDALKWIERIGGLESTMLRCQKNYEVLEEWVARTPWVDFLAQDKSVRSVTSVCLKVVDPWFENLAEEEKMPFIKSMTKLLDEREVAFDINGYRAAPAGLRIWCGASVSRTSLTELVPWLDWAFETAKQSAQ